MKLVWICLGGAVGSGARYLVSGWALKLFGPTFPYGTLAVNLLGSFLLAGVMQVGMTSEMMSPTLRLAVATGVLGGFTTYSTFSYETFKYLQDGAWGIAGLNIVATVLCCLVGCFAGYGCARWVVGS